MEEKKPKIDPKDLMAVERATTALFSTSISLIVLGFVVEKFELFLHLVSIEVKNNFKVKLIHESYLNFYAYLGIVIILAGVFLAIYTYFYYTRWISNLEKGQIEKDKQIYLALSIFISIIGILLILTMTTI
ncbi:DUF202 domain-containing protein [Persephonella sp.]|uniref:DUF202 domain-containing protein n=1 Tax=Persephonella sp. TaxID=2060922 RepID=UPI00260F11B0|nr:DUF202 domain-containing protein [Persephonella sp.]